MEEIQTNVSPVTGFETHSEDHFLHEWKAHCPSSLITVQRVQLLLFTVNNLTAIL
ncbi:hypothetical protein T02_5110 [Trichinella nativa]|uniref:Uncharacterized protein n=1 Tax=Trichinella nativa TaxID=6335 RepID=A0A0V1KJ27_9BILA|nr:hypothetical protein T02_5110 [Trichinella nativa]